MIYYIDTIEQIVKDGENTEYGARSKEGADLNAVLAKYYKKLSDVSADIGKNHLFMDIRIVNSLGEVVKKDAVGKYVDATAE